MTKNVTVTDAQGNIIGTTYPKRASGLIKNGRAIFVDDCTIRLSGKPEPSDTYNTSEVNQMNYILFNPRNWSFDQMQNNNQNSFGYGRNGGFSHSIPAERSFINDFDGGLVESLLFGDWNTSYVRAVSKELSLLPDTDYCFVFWLNGGENDSGSEICQLQIAFGGSWEECYTYKLNRNYIKPVLHKDGWELYSIPFRTPIAYSSAVAATNNNDTTPTIATNLAFVVGVAPMAVKPAKELAFYADWEDSPDEFASERPQRHNLVFADGWPSINQYGGDRYSTEAIRAKKAPRMRNVPPIPNIPSMPSNTADWSNSNVSGTLSDTLREHVTNLEEQAEAVSDFIENLQERCDELRNKCEDIGEQIDVTSNTFGKTVDYSVRISALEKELHALNQNVDSLFARYGVTDFNTLGMSDDAGESFWDFLETELDALESHADSIEGKLDAIEDALEAFEE